MAWIDTAPSSAADHAPTWGVVRNVAPEVISRVAARNLIIPLRVRLCGEITCTSLILLGTFSSRPVLFCLRSILTRSP